MALSRYLTIFFLSTALLLPLPALFNYYCDPYQIYHRSHFPAAGLVSNQRYQNAGLINTWLADPARGYDSILIGTSLSANFTVEDTQQYLHWHKPLRLFINGGGPAEQALMARHALDTNRVQKILWELHPSMYADYESNSHFDEKVFPFYLYNDTVLDDFPYLFNQDILKLSWELVTGNLSAFGEAPQSLGSWARHHKWIQEQHRDFNRSGVVNEVPNFPYLHLQDNRAMGSLDYPALANHLFSVIDSVCNGNVNIIFFIAPISKLYSLSDVDRSTRILYLPRSVLQRTARCRNIQLYAFDTEDFSNDFANYKDHEHYLPHINSYLLRQIGRGMGQLTLDNIDNYEAHFREILNTKAVASSYRE